MYNYILHELKIAQGIKHQAMKIAVSGEEEQIQFAFYSYRCGVLSILAIQSTIYLSSSGRGCALVPLVLIFNSQTLQRQIKAKFDWVQMSGRWEMYALFFSV